MIPFSSRALPDGSIEAAYRSSIERLIRGLEEKSHEVYCALVYAGWKLGGDTLPEDEFRHDFAEIDASDKLITLLEERVSAGVQLESGYAYAKGKKSEIYQIGKPVWSNNAFAKLNGNEIISVTDVTDFVEKALQNN